MTIWMVWFGLLVAAALVFLGSWVCLFLEGIFPGKGFDERQMQAHAKAYQHAFMLGIVYYFVVWLVIDQTDPDIETVKLLMLMGILLQAEASFAYMLLTDAVLPFSEKPTMMFLLFFLMSAIWLRDAFRSVSIEQQMFDTTDIPWGQLLLSVSWLFLGVIYLVSWLKERRHGE